MRLINFLTLFLMLGGAARAANVLVNLPAPYTQHVIADINYSLYIGGSITGSPNGGAFYNATPGYRFLKIRPGAGTTDRIWLDVSTDQKFTLTGTQVAAIQLTVGGTVLPVGGSVLPIEEASATTSGEPALCTPATCEGSLPGGEWSFAHYSGGIIRIGFSVTELCSAFPGSPICTGVFPGTFTQAITVTVGVVDYNNGSSTLYSTTNTTKASNLPSINISDVAPTISCPQFQGALSTRPEDYYFPGDQQIYVNPDTFGAAAGINGSPPQTIAIYASRILGLPIAVTANAAPTTGIEAGGYTAIGGGAQTIDGFVNTTNGSNNGYNATAYSINSVGIFSNGPACNFATPIFTQPISGILTESKCFIATAAFHDGRAAPVMLLRKFRDEVLTQFALGRRFIETYYAYSPALAEWAWDKPFVRSIALKALAPVELMAWAVLKLSHAEETSSQPYIDHLKEEMDLANPNVQVEDSYIDSVKKKLEGAPPPKSSNGYSESIKKDLKPEESAKGYSEKIKSSLPEEKYRESPIKMVKEKRDRLPTPDYSVIESAVSFKMGITPGMKVTNVANTKATATFANIYGGGFQPDVMFHFEHQTFHSENFGSFGLGLDGGFSYAEGFGQLAFPFGTKNTTQSQTKFSFIQLPILMDVIYRFNFFRILRPYASFGVGSMLYTEIRKDKQKDKRGYSFVYNGSVGCSLLLDFLDRATAEDSYLSNKIQHSYLFAEYNYLNTFAKTGVLFERGGVYAGFLFEY